MLTTTLTKILNIVGDGTSTVFTQVLLGGTAPVKVSVISSTIPCTASLVTNVLGISFTNPPASGATVNVQLLFSYATGTYLTTLPVNNPLPVFESFVPANPAAGQPCIVTVPNGIQWTVNGLNFSIVTSAATATRTAVITAKNATGQPMLQAFAAYGSAASQTCVVSFGPGESALTATVDFVYLSAQMGSMFLGPGATLTISFINLQAGDQISNIALMLQSEPTS